MHAYTDAISRARAGAVSMPPPARSVARRIRRIAPVALIVLAAALGAPFEARAQDTPGAPGVSKVTSGSEHLSVEWNEPGNIGGSPITHYKVRWAAQSEPNTYLNPGGMDGMDGMVVPGGRDVREFKIRDLLDGIRYQLQVAAVNTDGAGAWSGVQSKVPVTAIAICLGATAVTDLDACKTAAKAGYSVDGNLLSAQTIVVSVVREALGVVTFTLASAAGDNQISAGVDIEGSLPFTGTNIVFAADATASSASVTLTPKAGGDGGQAEVKLTIEDPSIRTTIFTLSAPGSARIPGAPALSALSAGGNKLTARWSVPADTGTSAISGYKIRWAAATAAGVYLNLRQVDGDAAGGAAARTHTITGLTDGEHYLVEVAAVNASGTGTWSAPQRGAPVTEPGVNVPGAPSLAVPVVGSGEFLLSWSAPVDPGGTPLRGYKVRWARSASPDSYLNAGRAAGDDTGDQTMRSYTITGLSDGTRYKIQVAAVNAAGTGAWSAAKHRTAIATIAVCLGAAAISGLVECQKAANEGYFVSASSSGAQTIFLSVVRRSTTAGAPPATYTLTATDGDNAIVADVDIEGSLPFDGAEVEIASGSHAGSTSVTLTPKAGGDGGSALLGFAAVASAGYQPGLFTLIKENLDVNQSGGDADWRDGVIIARYLAGLRGAALTDGVGGNADLGILIERITDSLRIGSFDIDGDGETLLADGIILARYLLGVRGDSLTAGWSRADGDAAAGKIEKLLGL